jgi:hypothetical protein
VEGVPQLAVGAAVEEEAVVSRVGARRHHRGAFFALRLCRAVLLRRQLAVLFLLLRGQRLLGGPLHPRRLPSRMGLLLIRSDAECWPAGHCPAGSPRPIGG